MKPKSSLSLMASMCICAAITLTGCGLLIPMTQGDDFDISQVSSIKKGGTTQSEVAKMFGEALLKGMDEKGPWWKYSYLRVMWFQGSVKRLQVWFDDKNVVKDFTFQEGPTTAAELLGR